MKSKAKQLKDPESQSESKSDPKDDLKSLPLPEVEIGIRVQYERIDARGTFRTEGEKGFGS